VPDLVDFTVTPIANATISVPRWTISGKVVNSKNQATVIQDFTGVNALTFPNVLSNLTAAERDELLLAVRGEQRHLESGQRADGPARGIRGLDKP